MRSPQDIAKILSENIHFNNGFLAEELPVNPDDQRLSQFMTNNPLKASGGGIIVMKRGTIIEANHIIDDGKSSIIKATVGKPYKTMVRGGAETIPGLKTTPELYSVEWVQLSSHERTGPVNKELRETGHTVKALTPEQVRGMLAASTTQDHEEDLKLAVSSVVRYVQANRPDMVERLMQPKNAVEIVRQLVAQHYEITIEDFMRLMKAYRQDPNALEPLGWNQRTPNTRGVKLVYRPYGKVLSIKRENILRIDRA